MPASRGMMTRAASALLFAATLGFSLAFPGSAAESPEGVARPLPVSNTVESSKAEVAGESDRLSASRLADLSGERRAVWDALLPVIPVSGAVPASRETCEAFLGIYDPVGNGFCLDIAHPQQAPFCSMATNCPILFQRIRDCNLDYNRRGANIRPAPGGCGAGCDGGLSAVGNKCVYEKGGVIQTASGGEMIPGIPATGAVPATRETCEAFLGIYDPVGNGFCLDIAHPQQAPFCSMATNCPILFQRIRDCNLDYNRRGANIRPAPGGCGAACEHGSVARGNKCVAPSGSNLPDLPEPPECVGPCGDNALSYEAVVPGGVLSVHDENGNEISSGDLVLERTLLTLTAEPNEHWYVTGWTGCSNGQTGSAGDEAAVKICRVHMPGDVLTVSVIFSAVSGRVLYERAVSGIEDGNLVVVGQLTAFSGGAVVVNGQLLDVGELLTMEATPERDYYVESWGGPCAGIGEVGTAEDADRVKGCVVTVFGGMGQIRANFASKPREEVDPTTKDDSVTIVVVDPGPPVMTVTLTGPTDIVVGRTIIIEANPDDGMCVSEWTGACGGGVGETGCIGEAEERKKCVLVVTPGLDLDDINPVYIPSPNLFQVSYRGEGMGTVSAYSERAVPVPGDLVSGGAVMEDARVSFLAVPAAGHYVAGWSGVCAGAPIGDNTAQGPALGGRTCHWVADRDATGADEAVARFALAPREPYTGPEINAALPLGRRAVRGAVAGYQGVILTVTTRDGSSLDFVPGSSGGLEVNAGGVVRSQGPVNGLLLGEFAAVLSRADREPQDVELDVRISVVRPPANPAALKALVGEDVSGPALNRPFGYESGGEFSVLSHGGYFNVDQNTGAITGNSPPAGQYTLTIRFVHPGFAGEILLDAEVRIFSQESGIPDAQLNPERIYLANGFKSSEELHRMEPDGSNVEVTRVNNSTSSSTNGGIQARIQNGNVVFNVQSNVSGTNLLRGEFSLVETNTQTNSEIGTPLGVVEAQGFASRIGVEHLVTEGLPGALAGDYLLAVGLPIDRTADPDIPAFANVEVVHVSGNQQAMAALSLEGPNQTEVSVVTDLAAGSYALTLTVRSLNGGFKGDQRLLLTVSVKRQDSVPLSLSDAIGLPSSPVVYVSPDYVGAGLSVSLGANLEFYLSDPAPVSGSSDFAVEQGAEVDGRRVAFTSRLLRALEDSEKTARVRVNIRCVAPKRCQRNLYQQLMNIVYRPTPPPVQPLGTIPAGEAIERTALAPAGFEGGVFEELTGEYENTAHEALFTVSPAGVVSGGVQPVGIYKIPVGYSTPNAAAVAGAGGFLGTIKLTMTVEVVQRDIALESGLDMALLRPPVFAVAPDYADALLTMTLRGAQVNLDPDQGVAGGVFSWGQSDREVVLGLDSPLNAPGLRGVRMTLVESVSQNYRDRQAVVFLTVRGVTVRTKLVGGPGSTLVFPYQSNQVADLSDVDAAFAGATFTQPGGASATGLNLASNGVVSTDGELGRGEYRVTAEARGALFKGVAKLTLSVSVQDKLPVESERSILEADRDKVIYAGTGYVGQAVVYRPQDILRQVRIRTPSSPPPGLTFDAGDFGPQGFTVSVQQISEGFSLDSLFTVTALAPDRSETPIELRLRIVGIDPVAQNPQNAEYGVASEVAPLRAPSRISGGDFVFAGLDLGIDGSGGSAPSAATDDYNVRDSAVYYAPTPPLGDGGAYRVRANYTHSELLGSVVFYQPVRIQRSRLTEAERIAEADLSANVTVTPDFKGVFYSVSPQNSAAVDLIPGIPTDGRIKATNPNPDTVDFSLPFALGGELSAEASTEITESGGVNYHDETTAVYVRVSALAEVDDVQLGTLAQSRVQPGSLPILDFGEGFYGLGGVQFSAGAGTSPGLNVRSGGEVVVGATALGGGLYQAVAEASSPSRRFLGTVSFRLNFEVAPDPQDPAWGLTQADLNSPRIAVSPFHTGEVHRISLSAQEAARVDLIPDPPSDPRLLASSASGGDEVVFFLPAALGGERELTAETRIQEDAGPNYTRLHETATVRLTSGVIPADQRISFGATAAMAQAGTELLNFGDDPAYAGEALSFTPLSESGLEVDAGGTLRVGGADLGAGVYNFRAGAVSDDGSFLGTLYFQARVEVTLSPLPDNEGIREADSIARGVLEAMAAPGYTGEVYRITLSGSDVDVLNAPLTRSGVRAEQSGRDLVFRAVSAVNSQESRLSQFELEEGVAGGRHVSRRTQVGVQVRGTNTDLVAVTRGNGNVVLNAEIANLRAQDAAYAGATFGRVGSQSPDLQVNNAGLVSAKRALSAGSFLLTATAVGSGGDFYGTATMTVSLLVSSDPTVTDANGIATNLRGIAVMAAPGYAGSVAFFETGNAAVALRTPSSTPPGLIFDTDRDYGRRLTVFLAAGAAPSAGATRAWSFNVTAKQSGSVDTPVALAVTVAGVSSPQQSYYQQDASGSFSAELTRPAAHAGGVFTEVLRAEDGEGNSRVHPFSLNEGGTLTANNLTALDSGRYVVFAGYAADGFLGTLALELTVDLYETPSAEAVVAERNVTVYAGASYAGIVYQAAADDPSAYSLSRSSTSHPSGFLFDNDSLALMLDGALGANERSGAVTLDVSCLGASRNCRAFTTEVNVRVIPLTDPGQAPVTVISGSQDFQQNLAFPPEGRANENNQGRQLDVVGVDSAGGLLPTHFAVTRAGLLRHVGAGIPRGTHRITVRVRRGAFDPAFFQGEFFLVATVVGEDENQLSLSDANLALPNFARVTALVVAEGYAGIVHEVVSHFPAVSLFFTPLAANNLAIDSNGVVRVSQPLAADASGSFPVEMRREGFASRTRNVAVNLSKLDALRLTVSLTRLVDSDGDLLTLAAPNFPDALFKATTLPAGMELFGNRLRTNTPGGLAEGRHYATLSATEPNRAFLGTLFAEAEFAVAPAPPAVPDADSVRVDLRSATLTVVSGYTGSVAFFAAEDAGVILETPSSPPQGFAVDSGQFLGANGFTVSVTVGLSGRSRSGQFLVTAQRAGERKTAITLDAQVEWLAATPLTEIFGFVDTLPDALTTLAVDGFPNASFAPVFVSRGLTLAGAVVRLDGPAAEGTYLLTAEATDPGFVGRQTVSFRLEAEGGTVALTRERALGAARTGLTVFGALGYQGSPLVIFDARSGVEFYNIGGASSNYQVTGDIAGNTNNRWRRVLVDATRDYTGFGANTRQENWKFPREMRFQTSMECYFADGRVCEPEQLRDERVTVHFELVESPEQPLIVSTINAQPFVPAQGALRRPAGFETGGYFSKLSDDAGLFEVDSGGGVSQTFPNTPLTGDRTYTVTAALNYPEDDLNGFKGTLEMPLTIVGYVERLPIPDTDAIPPEQLRPGTIYVAELYPAGGELHTASPQSRNLTVIVEEPLPQQFSAANPGGYSRDYGVATLTGGRQVGPSRVGGTLSVPNGFLVQSTSDDHDDFRVTLTLVAVDANGEWDQRYARRVEVMEFSTRRLDKYSGNAGRLTVSVQQAEPNALAGADLLTLSLIDEAPGARFVFAPDRPQLQAMLRMTLVGTNPATLAARTDLFIADPNYGGNPTPPVIIRVSDPTNGFRGTLTLTANVRVQEGKPVTLTDDRAVLRADRYATIFAARGLQGALYTMTLNPGVVFGDIFSPPGLGVRKILDDRGLQVRLLGDASVTSDLSTRRGRLNVTCQHGIPCVPAGETARVNGHQLELDWEAAIRVVNDPGQKVIRATVFDRLSARRSSARRPTAAPPCSKPAATLPRTSRMTSRTSSRSRQLTEPSPTSR